jgi:hypothetical protein
MRWSEAFDKFKAENEDFNKLSRMERTAFAFGFIDGFKMAQEERDELLAACEAVLIGDGQNFLNPKARTSLKQVIAKIKSEAPNA